eukprot:2765492-Alexandrium_andersonii.AAC.1
MGHATDMRPKRDRNRHATWVCCVRYTAEHGLTLAPTSHREVHPVPLFALIPNPPTELSADTAGEPKSAKH